MKEQQGVSAESNFPKGNEKRRLRDEEEKQFSKWQKGVFSKPYDDYPSSFQNRLRN